MPRIGSQGHCSCWLCSCGFSGVCWQSLVFTGFWSAQLCICLSGQPFDFLLAVACWSLGATDLSVASRCLGLSNLATALLFLVVSNRVVPLSWLRCPCLLVASGFLVRRRGKGEAEVWNQENKFARSMESATTLCAMREHQEKRSAHDDAISFTRTDVFESRIRRGNNRPTTHQLTTKPRVATWMSRRDDHGLLPWKPRQNQSRADNIQHTFQSLEPRLVRCMRKENFKFDNTS